MSVTHPQFDGQEFLFLNLLLTRILVFLTGLPGATKTLFTIELAARLSRGLAPGDRFGTPINVLYISTENDARMSIGPRFHVAHGDNAHFKHIEETFFLPSNLRRLRFLIRKHQAGLVILDPIKNFYDAKVNSSVEKTTQCLEQINKLARDTNCTILGVDWPSKSRRKGDLSVSGNAAFTGKPRQTIAVGRLTRDEWVVGITKSNDTAEYVGWVYGTEVVDIGIGANGVQVTAKRIIWKRPAKPSEVMSAHEQAHIDEDPNLEILLQFMNPSRGKPKGFKTQTLVDYLNKVELIGQKKARDLLKSARNAGYLEQKGGGQGSRFQVTWKITDMGVLKLAPSEEETEATIEKVFPPMEIDLEPLANAMRPRQQALGNGRQLALGSGINGQLAKRIVRRVSKRPAKRHSKGGA